MRLSPTHLVVKPVASNPMMPGSNPVQRNMMRLPANPPRSLPQPPRSLPMPPTYRQTGPPPTSNSLIRAPSTSLLSNRSVYSVNKPNGKSSQQNHVNRQLPQPKQRDQQQPPQSQQGNRGVYYQPVAVLPQTPSPKKSSIPNGKNGGNGIPQNGGSNGSKPISPYIVSVNSPPSASPDHSPTSSGHITNSSGSNVSTGSSSSQSSNEGSIGTNGGSKYTRVPPPRYRPHQPPLAQRRPLSGGPYQHHHQQDQAGQRMNQSNSQGHPEMYNQQGQHGHGQHGQQGGNLRQNRYGGKSTSAESVLTVNGQRGGSGQAGHGQQAHSTSKNYDQYGNNPSASSSTAGMKSSNR